MSDNLADVKNILDKYNQNHLFSFYDELPSDKKAALLGQIKSTNFELILNLYRESKQNDNINLNEISPIPHIEKQSLSKNEIDYYTSIGEDIIKSNSLAIVTLAGGQGTRLGYKGPKGTYELKFVFFKKSLFEIICDNIKKTNQKYNIVLPWYIMTSQENDFATKEYFRDHNFFGYPSDNIFFFKQESLPLIDIDGKLILEEPYRIKYASCGNGNVFKVLKESGNLQKMKDDGIKWISFGGIDNILLKTADPLFIGLTVHNNYKIASKTIFKEQPLEKTAVFCKRNNHPTILDYSDITLELSEKKDENGFYMYREANMLSHLMAIDAVEKSTTFDLRFHRAFKKNAFVNKEGVKQVPDGPNSFKFENFIFDAFYNFDDMLLFRVNPDEEFAPIKSFTGIHNPDTAMDKYESYYGLPKHDL